MGLSAEEPPVVRCRAPPEPPDAASPPPLLRGSCRSLGRDEPSRRSGVRLSFARVGRRLGSVRRRWPLSSVRNGANVAAGQIVGVAAQPEHEPARGACTVGLRGGRSVSSTSATPTRTCGVRSSSSVRRTPRMDAPVAPREGAHRRGARGFDPHHGRSRARALRRSRPPTAPAAPAPGAPGEVLRQTNDRLVNWTIVPYPNEGWAETASASRIWSVFGMRSPVSIRLDE